MTFMMNASYQQRLSPSVEFHIFGTPIQDKGSKLLTYDLVKIHVCASPICVVLCFPFFFSFSRIKNSFRP